LRVFSLAFAVSRDEGTEVLSTLVVAVVKITLDGGQLGGAVHRVDLAVHPWMFHRRQPMHVTVLIAGAIENMAKAYFRRAWLVGPDTVVRQHGVDGIRHGYDQVTLELGTDHLAPFPMQPDKGELAGSVDRNK
jgi:hypothetical protein